jgi:hypothetical protein
MTSHGERVALPRAQVQSTRSWLNTRLAVPTSSMVTDISRDTPARNAFGEPRYRGGSLGLAQRQIGERPQALAVLLALGALRAPLAICS